MEQNQSVLIDSATDLCHINSPVPPPPHGRDSLHPHRHASPSPCSVCMSDRFSLFPVLKNVVRMEYGDKEQAGTRCADGLSPYWKQNSTDTMHLQITLYDIQSDMKGDMLCDRVTHCVTCCMTVTTYLHTRTRTTATFHFASCRVSRTSRIACTDNRQSTSAHHGAPSKLSHTSKGPYVGITG